MNPDDDRDLAAAFEGLHAPASTAGYAHRTPSLEAVDRVAARRWPQGLAGVLAVLLALAGAGTFLALRTARQGGVAGGAGYPPARAYAAMAYDSAAGRTVMYGGTSAAGTALHDTWLWDGSSWSSDGAGSPGTLAGARMSDDPADGGVLLVGLAVPSPVQGGGGAGCGVASAGAVTGTAATVAPPATPLAGAPLASAPPATTPPPTAPLPSCAPSAPVQPAMVQTWLLHGGRWTRVAESASGTDVPSPGSTMAYDAASGEVIAVAVTASCGPPLMRPAVEPDLICPVAASGSSAASPPCPSTTCGAMPCRVDCGASGALSTWTWSGGHWTRRLGAIVPAASAAQLISDSLSPHLTLVTETLKAPTCTQPLPAPSGCSVDGETAVFTWVGSSWSQIGNSSRGPAGTTLAAAAVASTAGSAIAMTSDGELYSWSPADPVWTLQSPATRPGARAGAAMAEGPSGSIVLFGGVPIAAGKGAVTSTAQAPASDTWTWDGSSWHRRGGSVPPAPSASSCSDVGTLSNPCVHPTTVPAPRVSGAPGGAPMASDPIGA